MDDQFPSSQNSRQSGITLPGWAILPLRLFLGVSFLIAGLDKLGDPAFLDPTARQYIGRQISGFAPDTPLERFLLNVAVPNAGLFGVMVMGGELCIGVAVLLGLLTRFSAAMGLLINLIFFLSATWDVHPFYFGADLPYVFGWLTLLLAGSGPFALDHLLKDWLQTRPSVTVGAHSAGAAGQAETLLTRRALLGAGVAGLVGTVLAGTGLGWGVLHAHGAEVVAQAEPTPRPAKMPIEPPTPSPSFSTAEATSPAMQPPPTSTIESASVATAAPAATTEPTQIVTQEPVQVAGRVLVAAPGAVAVGESLDFILPSGDPAVLVHTQTGYSAYIAICTHQGCVVHLNTAGVLRCPCHGAEFDPTAKAQVLRGPARRPLSPVAITVNADGSIYLVG